MRNWYGNISKRDWGYVQWKPVVYTREERLNADLSNAKSYPNIAEDKSYIMEHIVPNRSLFRFYFLNNTIDVSILYLIINNYQLYLIINNYQLYLIINCYLLYLIINNYQLYLLINDCQLYLNY